MKIQQAASQHNLNYSPIKFYSMKRIDMKRILTTVLLVLTMASPLFSQNSPEQLVEKFFQDYENKGVSAAIDNLYSTNKWVERNKDAITKVKNQMLSFTIPTT